MLRLAKRMVRRELEAGARQVFEREHGRQPEADELRAAILALGGDVLVKADDATGAMLVAAVMQEVASA